MGIPESARVIYFMGGVVHVGRPQFLATWISHDFFDIQGEYVSIRDCDEDALAAAAVVGMLLTFTNARPPKQNPSASNGLWAKLLRLLRWGVPS